MRVTSKGQVTIPKPVRDRLGIGPGSEVEFVQNGDVVVFRKRSLEREEDYDSWAAGVAGLVDTRGMDGKAYVDWLRGPRDDIDPH